jgi:hypothetical protein
VKILCLKTILTPVSFLFTIGMLRKYLTYCILSEVLDLFTAFSGGAYIDMILLLRQRGASLCLMAKENADRNEHQPGTEKD